MFADEWDTDVKDKGVCFSHEISFAVKLVLGSILFEGSASGVDPDRVKMGHYGISFGLIDNSGAFSCGV